MRSAKIAVILVIIISLILWCRRDYDFGHIARVLPFSGGHRPGIYDIGAVAIVLLLLWGFSRLKSGARPSEQSEYYDDEEPYEEEDYGDDDDDE